MAKKYEMDMTEGALLPKLVVFSLPLMASGMLQLLFNAADIIVVGRFTGASAMAAVGSTSSLINLFIQIFMGLSVGVNVCAARYYGAQKYDDLRQTISTAVTTALISGTVLIAVGVLLAHPMLLMMGSPEDVIEQSALYLRIYFAGMPFVMLYNFVSAILRAVGDTKRPLYYLMQAGIINVFLDLALVAGLGWGVAGAALATTVSQAYSAVRVLGCLVKDEGALKLDIKRLGIDRAKFVQIFRVGLPAGLQGTVFSFSNVIIQSSINSFGSVAMAGSAASANIEGFVYNAMNAMYQANLSFTSQNVGAKKYTRINRIMMDCVGLVVTIGLVLGLSAVLFDGQLLSIYNDSADVISYGEERLLVICGSYFLCGMMDVMVGSLRGLGYSVIPMIVSLTGACGFRIVWIATIFQIPQFHTLTCLYLSYPISWIMTFSAHMITFLIVRNKFPRTDG